MSKKNNPLQAVKGVLAGGKQNFIIILAAIALFAIFTLINPGFVIIAFQASLSFTISQFAQTHVH